MSLVSQPAGTPAILTSMFNRAEISQQSGSEHANLALLCVDGYSIDSNIFALPVVKTVHSKDSTDMPSELSAENTVYRITGGKHEGSIESEFMQQGMGTKMFYKDFGGLHAALCFEEHLTDVAGVYQCLFIPNAIIDKVGDRTSPGLGMKQNYYPMPSSADIVIKLSDWTAGFNNPCSSVSTFTIPKDSMFIGIEYSPTSLICVH